jgi:rhamnosyltransferase
MSSQGFSNVAVLLATYNGGQYVHEQITSLKDNEAPFTLHWLDDHSTDETREIVRASAERAAIPLREWHQVQHMGVPQAFFQLLESVEADIYLFCDQDDIWQPGKIDATVANLLPDLESPVLCFSDSLLFYGAQREGLRRLSESLGSGAFLKQGDACRMFLPSWTPGHSQGFTRPLRDLFLSHAGIARTYAGMHDFWMYDLAIAAGKARILADAPVVLYRRHRSGWTSKFGKSKSWLASIHRYARARRLFVARHARGFVLASRTLPGNARLNALTHIAQLLATLNRRQSPAALARLMDPEINLFRGHFADYYLAANLLLEDVPFAEGDGTS